jgi:hypothetical protein
MKNIYLKIGMTGSIAGCILVAFNEPLLTNMIWVIFNPFMIFHNYQIKEYKQATLWGLYVIIAIGGIVNYILGG